MSPILGSFAGLAARGYGLTAGVSPIVYPASNFYSIATATPAGINNTTFSSIPQTYSHLQLRISMVGAAGGSLLVALFNGDTGANYTWHDLNGNGSTANSYSATAQNFARIYGRNVGTSTTAPTVAVVDLLDYRVSGKNRVMRALSGSDQNGSGEVELESSLWVNTTAISSLTVKTHDGANFAAGTSIALYGVL